MSEGDRPADAHFARSMAAASTRADRESIDDIGTSLVRQIATLQLLGEFLSLDYRALYDSEEARGWLKLTLYTEGLYQQMHAVATTAAVLVGRCSSPPLEVPGLTQLEQRANAETHPLASQLRRRKREIDLLKWFLRVRNKAIQHSAEAGYVGSRGVVRTEAFALQHAGIPPSKAALRKANDLFVGLHRRYGDPQQGRVESREAVTYLDLFSHHLFETAPADFDSARRVVADAQALDVIVSAPVLRNADIALSALIDLAPEHPNRLKVEAGSGFD